MTHSTRSAPPNPDEAESPPPFGAPPESTPKKRLRVVQWFTQKDALQSLRGQLAETRVSAHSARAERALNLGDELLSGAETHSGRDCAALALESYRRGLFWGLLAKQQARKQTAPGEDEPRVPDSESAQTEYESLLELLSTPPNGASSVSPMMNSKLREWLLSPDFAELEMLTASTQKRRAEQVRQLLVAELAHGRRLELTLLQHQRRRLVRSSLLVLLGLTLTGWLIVKLQQPEHRDNLLAGKSFVTSSSWKGCQLEEGRCGSQLVDIFFCTNSERNPSIVYDLGMPTEFSTVAITNRSDCCAKRAVPMIVETSNDRSNWKEFARRKDVFSQVELERPGTEARYLRLRVPRTTVFHLEAVEVYK